MFICCGCYHINIDMKNITLTNGIILVWRVVMIGLILALFVNETELGIEYFELRHTLIVVAILLQLLVIIPIILHVTERFNCKITRHQINTLDKALVVFKYFLLYGVLMSIGFACSLFYTGLFYFNNLRLSLEAIGYLMGTLLVNWAILFVVWDALTAQGELMDFLILAKNHDLSSEIYKNGYMNRYAKNELNSAGISNTIAFCAYLNLFVFAGRCLTTPESESLMVTAIYGFVLLSREASFIFFCFPYFAGVNKDANTLTDLLSDAVWHHPNNVDCSISLCLLAIRKPYQVAILGRVVTVAEMKGQFSGVVFVTLTSLLRVFELQEYG